MDKLKLLLLAICAIIGAQIGYIILHDVTGKKLIFMLLSIVGLIFSALAVWINMKRKATKNRVAP